MIFGVKKNSYEQEFYFASFSLLKIRKVRNEFSFNILNGMFSISIDKNVQFTLKFLGIVIFVYYKIRIDNEAVKEVAIFSSKTGKEFVREFIFKKILKETEFLFKNYFFIRSPIGEIYILQHFIQSWLNKNHIEKNDFCLVGGYILSALRNLYNPDLECKYIRIPVEYIMCAFDDEKYQYKNYSFYIYSAKNFIYELLERYNNGITEPHFVDAVLNYYNCNRKDLTEIQPRFNENIEKRVFDKLKTLDFENYVILMPEANSLFEIPLSVWEDIDRRLKNLGYSTYWNVCKNNSLYINHKSVVLSVDEMLYFAQRAKGIVALCSGFFESLTRVKAIKCVLYTNMILNNIPCDIIRAAYCKKLFPFADNNLYEYDYSEENKEKIISDIISKLEVDHEQKNYCCYSGKI